MAGYLGNVPVPQATMTFDKFTATAGQTSFATSGYTPNFLQVYLNGVHLVNGTDYTASNGSDVVLTSGATTGDNLEVVSYSTYEVNAQTYTGGLTAKNDGAAAITANRLSSDGTILDLKKDGTSVGQIGVDFGTEFFVGGGGSGFYLNTAAIRPTTGGAASTITDGTINFGSSTGRWKDLYLSGGVYLGGTGSANLLDDYEEGTFTPSILGYSGTTYADQQGKYTKIGNLVIAEILIDVSSIGSFISNSRIEGWPFAASAAIRQSVGQVRLGLANATTVNANSNSLYMGFYLNTATAFLYSQTGSTYNGNVWQAGVIAATAVYRTNS